MYLMEWKMCCDNLLKRGKSNDLPLFLFAIDKTIVWSYDVGETLVAYGEVNISGSNGRKAVSLSLSWIAGEVKGEFFK